MKYRLWAGLCAVLLCLALPQSVFFCRAEDELTVTEAFFGRKETNSGWVMVPGRGIMRYYAQNDGLWGNLTYENKNTDTRRPFRDSGCSPSAVAMAIRQLIPDEDLKTISQYAKNPFSLCPCSLNRERCEKRHARYILTSDKDFDRFLPLVMGDFAAGNNTLGAVSRSSQVGTGSGYIHHIAKVYGLDMAYSSDLEEALEALQRGKAVISLAARGAAFTNTGHYILLAHADEEKIYILDPLARSEYKTKHGSKVHIIQPGLVYMNREEINFAGLKSFIILSKPQ